MSSKKLNYKRSWLTSKHSDYETHNKKIWIETGKGKTDPEQIRLYKEYNTLFDELMNLDPMPPEKIKELDSLVGKINDVLEVGKYLSDISIAKKSFPEMAEKRKG